MFLENIGNHLVVAIVNVRMRRDGSGKRYLQELTPLWKH